MYMYISYKLMTVACTQNYHKRILVMKSFSGEGKKKRKKSISTLTLLISYHKDNTILAILEHDTEKRTSVIFFCKRCIRVQSEYKMGTELYGLQSYGNTVDIVP